MKIDWINVKSAEQLLKFSEKIPGGKADSMSSMSIMSIMNIAKKHNTSSIYIKDQLEKGIKVEMEHTKDRSLAEEIAKDLSY